MSCNWFQGRPDVMAPAQPVEIESIDRDRFFGPENYEAEDGLRDAVNAALLLDQPLLLTGEPGTGKTQLAEKLALELAFPLFKFETKSTSVAQDLFYTFDHVGRFQTAQVSKDAAALHASNFIDFGALGKAVVQSLQAAEARALFPAGNLPAWYSGPGRAVVLIDEIDKAPSDLPNDALNEIERHYFRIRELQGGLEVKAAARQRPVLVITSNSEKQLPDAFLRRCIFYHLQPIGHERLRRIALRRLAALQVQSGPLLEDALQLFFDLRKPEYDLRKRPSTAEFLSFVAALSREPGALPEQALQPAHARRVLATLVKAPEDQTVAARHSMIAAASR
ncbi:MAG: ATPase family associated with various cellular activities (AAA) [Candidatus Accumulibacter appositus]|uniref:ATPase family associated with various cellular activities (AAA) n=1 Tax=Candidatus Accumulibacter appositus TaxID=1454003 RepID=A0A011NUV4_9PROT|nr:MoxR family ATPase [Accumulibacter sp.]EXI79136.1 MAG: ATPase family associated with various cellular activities (AAA) [Candidatus Accumulibacter appositus]HRF05504.1 MoxR family ATPase [Accumulibacter sp.]